MSKLETQSPIQIDPTVSLVSLRRHQHDTSFSNAARARVLVIDADCDASGLLCACLMAHGHQVVVVQTAAQGLAEARRGAFDVAFVDLEMQSGSGLDVIHSIRAASPWLRVIITAACPSVERAVEAIRRGAADYLAKPLLPSRVKSVLKTAMEAQSLERKAATLKGPVAGNLPSIDLMATASAEMRRAAELARRAADGTATILIRGESGTGKRTLARAIHGWSRRASRPLVIAGSLAPTPALLEAEWFGTAKKMPGGVATLNAGRVSFADGGTFLIEDVDKLSLSTQAKLLRLIQHQEYERPHAFAPLKADLRFIATTSGDLEARVAAGQFSQDLLYSLQTVQIDLPPLRHRAMDIEPLANQYLAFFAERAGRPCVGFSEAAIEALHAHSWPGNIRELRNRVERAVLVSRGEIIDISEVSPDDLNSAGSVALGDPVPLERIEELHIRAVLQAAPSIEAAAETLGMDSVTLWRRRKKYGI